MDDSEQPTPAENTYLPPGYMETGRITIAKGIGPSGSLDSAFRVEGMSATEAIGHLTTVLDRVRDDQLSAWRNRTDPNTGEE